jgi:large conductance mechanosensitive channel
MIEEFKKFILKGNMVDLAVGVIIGAAFGKVVERFSDMLMSVIGWILGLCGMESAKLNFDTVAPAGIKVGGVITSLINLLLVGLALFLFIKAYNKWILKPVPVAAPTPPAQTPTEKLLAEIRDELKARSYPALGKSLPEASVAHVPSNPATVPSPQP